MGARLGGALAVAACALAVPARGGDDSVLEVGGARVTVAELAARAALLAPFQLARFGAAWPEQLERWVDEVVVPELLLVESGARERTVEHARTRDKALARALLAEERRRVDRAPIAEAAVTAHYEQHRSSFDTPAALELWRILVASEAEARELIALLRGKGPAEFRRLARERSLDRATYMRGGNLGFVAADGQTHMPELRVSKSLFEAASRAADGALVESPVPEGQQFAVVLRRSSRAARAASLPAVRPQIEQRLAEAAWGEHRAALLARLRSASLREHHPELLDDFEPVEPDVSAARPPRASAIEPRAVDPTPQPTERGLR